MPYNWDAPFEVRDIRNGEWYWVQKEILESGVLNASDKLVYSALAYFANNKTQECFPSYTRICELIKLSRNTVIKGVRNLIKHGVLSKKKKKGRTNFYDLLKVRRSKSCTSANSALVQKRTRGSAKEDLVLVQKKTSNKTYLNKTKLTREEEEDVLIPSKKTNPLHITRGQTISFLKAFPTISTTELKEQIILCNNYMGMSSENIKNPGLFFRKWLTRYSKEKRDQLFKDERKVKQDAYMSDISNKDTQKNLNRVEKIKSKIREGVKRL